MAPYDFKAPDADAILRSSDGKELRVHRLILSLSSPIFQGMFGLPQPTSDLAAQIPTIDVSDPSDILTPFIQYLYPLSPPKIADLSAWAALYAIADKYGAGVVMERLRDMLVPRFLETSPLRVYALASRWRFEEEAKAASKRTLRLDILKDFSEEDAEIMGGVACQRLLFLHFNRRAAAQALVKNHPLPSSNGSACTCDKQDYSTLIQILCERVGKIPWLTAEEMEKAIVKQRHPRPCSAGKDNCRNAVNNVYPYFSSLLKGISDLPQTI